MAERPGARREVLLALLGAALLATGAALRLRDAAGVAERGLLLADGPCRVPVTQIEAPGSARIADMVLMHGLAANRALMRPTARVLARAGIRVFLLESPGHGKNTDAFSFAGAESCAAQAAQELAARREIELSRTVLAGHSMGGALAMGLADEFPGALAVVAISPAPFSLPAWLPRAFLPFRRPAREPQNLLLIMAQFDLPYAAGSNREYALRDGAAEAREQAFRAGRARRYVEIPLTSHGRVLMAARSNQEIIAWVHRAAGVPQPQQDARGGSVWPFLPGLAGILLLAPGLQRFLLASAARAGQRGPEPAFEFRGRG
jgi:pimeloyl-ACP methyl ester carboxylesterase